MKQTVLRFPHISLVAALLCLVVGCGPFGIDIPLGNRNLSNFSSFQFENDSSTADPSVQAATIQAESDGHYTVQMTIYHAAQIQGQSGTTEQLPVRDLTQDETDRMLEVFSKVRLFLSVPIPGTSCPPTLLPETSRVFVWDDLRVTERYLCSSDEYEYIAGTDSQTIYSFLQDLASVQ